jgi:hypothetical protein
VHTQGVDALGDTLAIRLEAGEDGQAGNFALPETVSKHRGAEETGTSFKTPLMADAASIGSRIL